MTQVRMIILNDNVGSVGLLNDWGWSIYIEAHDQRALFDADTSPSIIEHNSRILGIDLEKLDFAVLSHHHGDHYGGFSAIAEKHPDLPIYIPPGDTGWLQGLRLRPIIVDKPIRIKQGFWLSGPLEAWSGFYEQALGIEMDDWLVVVVGCSHPGVDVLAERLHRITSRPILLVIGGFHSPTREQLDKLAKISKYICPTHCSGWEAKRYVAQQYPNKYCEARTGTRITITKSLTIITEHFPY